MSIHRLSFSQGGVAKRTNRPELVDIAARIDAVSDSGFAYFDRGPIHEDALVLGGYWSAYWYRGRIYGTEIARGLDVFALEPSEFLTANEIAAAELADQGEVFNPQQQHPVSWPAEPVVARAYIDQLLRSEALDEAASALAGEERDRPLARALRRLARDLSGPREASATARRQRALARTLKGIARRLSQGRRDRQPGPLEGAPGEGPLEKWPLKKPLAKPLEDRLKKPLAKTKPKGSR